MQVETARVRSHSYWFLSSFFLERPDSVFVARIAESLAGAQTGDGDAVFGPLLAELAAALPAARSEGLMAEYTRLFGGIQSGYGPAPPFESVHREDRLLGETTRAVLDHYRDAGFGDIEPAAGPQDHLGVELRFMALLCLREAQAREAGDEAAAAAWTARQARFLDQHLLNWVPGYCAGLARESRQPFYVAVARLTAAACDHDRNQLPALDGR